MESLPKGFNPPYQLAFQNTMEIGSIVYRRGEPVRFDLDMWLMFVECYPIWNLTARGLPYHIHQQIYPGAENLLYCY